MQVIRRLSTSIASLLSVAAFAQAPPPGSAAQASPPPVRRPGGFIPGQQRSAADPQQLERGNKVYGISCRGCHGPDLRGGDMGGPNLLRSQLALSDRDGERIVPVIQGSLQASGMPAINMSPEDAKAVAAYVRSVLGTIGGQGKPPSSIEPPTIIVGNAKEGQAFFAAKCSGCHSVTGDLKGIASKFSDPKVLQNTWIAGAERAGRGSARPSAAVTVTATLTLSSGETLRGNLAWLDDFLVILELPDGSRRSFRRDGDVPKVDVHDPLSAHRELLAVLSDKDLHDVTAYLVTVK